MIVVVGSNPSTKSISQEPFSKDTSSGRTVRGWLGSATDITFVNVYDSTTPNNRPLKRSEIKSCLSALSAKMLGATAIIAVGRTAQVAISLLKPTIPVFNMPHPSGRCRVWNDKGQQAKYLLALNQFLQQVTAP